MVMKQIYKTKGEHCNPMAQKLPGTVMRKRERKTHREAEKSREGERQRKVERERENISKERVKAVVILYLFCLIRGKANISHFLP